MSGRMLVVCMFVFGALSVSVLYVYSVLNAGPFLELQRALAEEFKDSKPKVEGGRHRMNRGEPKVLRIIMQVDFDPESDEQAAEEFADRVTNFSRTQHDLTQYDQVEMHFVFPVPEKRYKTRKITRDAGSDQSSTVANE